MAHQPAHSSRVAVLTRHLPFVVATMWRLWPGATPACQHHTICLSSHLHEGGAVAANAAVALSESWLDRFPQRVCDFPRRTISTSLHPRSEIGRASCRARG